MKKWIPIFLILVVFYSCKDDDPLGTNEAVIIYESGDQEYGWATGKKNGVEFAASGMGITHSDKPEEYFGLRFNTYSIEGDERESFSFNKIAYDTRIFTVSGAYDTIYNGLVGSGGYLRLYGDGDVLGEVYILDESQNNYLEVISFDTINNLITGKFDVSFIIDDSFPKVTSGTPDAVRFSEVEFEVSVLD